MTEEAEPDESDRRLQQRISVQRNLWAPSHCTKTVVVLCSNRYLHSLQVFQIKDKRYSFPNHWADIAMLFAVVIGNQNVAWAELNRHTQVW